MPKFDEQWLTEKDPPVDVHDLLTMAELSAVMAQLAAQPVLPSGRAINKLIESYSNRLTTGKRAEKLLGR